MSQRTHLDASFIVRIWWEDRSQNTEAPVWRGQVQHVASGETAGFCSRAELWDFLLHWTGASAPGNGPPPGNELDFLPS